PLAISMRSTLAAATRDPLPPAPAMERLAVAGDVQLELDHELRLGAREDPAGLGHDVEPRAGQAEACPSLRPGRQRIVVADGGRVDGPRLAPQTLVGELERPPVGGLHP